ncbi:hypothetical protein FZH47_21825, partial [Salmonella enterica]|nr:hypothetical protein [Salmonella enterica]
LAGWQWIGEVSKPKRPFALWLVWSIFGYGGKYHFFIDYMQKISLRKGDYAGQGGGSWYS